MVWGGSMLYSFEYMKDIQRSIRNIELEALKEKNIFINEIRISKINDYVDTNI